MVYHTPVTYWLGLPFADLLEWVEIAEQDTKPPPPQ